MTSAFCLLDDSIVPLAEARIPVTDHGLLYGDGVFEGIRFYHGQPFLLDEHLRRLRDSAQAISLSLPWSDSALRDSITRLIEVFGHGEGYIRLIVTRGDGPLGIDPAACPKPRLITIVDELNMIAEEKRRTGIDIVIASTRRMPPDSLDPRIKSLNYLNAILARIEANRCGADEAVMLNHQGLIAEGTADNVFIVSQDRLLTPPVSAGALAGITRRLIMGLAKDVGIPCLETDLAAFDLHSADECFLTGTGAELIPVRHVDGRAVRRCPGPVFTRLQSAFRDYITKHCQEDNT